MTMVNRHESAVEAAISAVRGLTAVDGPLVELVRALAQQVDASGPEGPGSRLAGTYLVALRTLMARLGPVDPGPSRLSQLRAEHPRVPVRTKRRESVS